ncbi:MAG: hypothetical protein AAF483_00305 [Planctomycetota bacterium]
MSKSHSGGKKVLWIILSLLFGCLGSMAYAVFGTESARLRSYSLKGFALGIVVMLGTFGCTTLLTETSEDSQLVDSGQGTEQVGNESVLPSNKSDESSTDTPREYYMVDDDLERNAMVLFTSIGTETTSSDENGMLTQVDPNSGNSMDDNVDNTGSASGGTKEETSENPFHANWNSVAEENVAEAANAETSEFPNVPAKEDFKGFVDIAAERDALAREKKLAAQRRKNEESLDQQKDPQETSVATTPLVQTFTNVESVNKRAVVAPNVVNRYLSEGVSPTLAEPANSIPSYRNRYTRQ